MDTAAAIFAISVFAGFIAWIFLPKKWDDDDDWGGGQ